jgi:hypothetical protein
MSSDQQIVFGQSPEKPAVTLRHCGDPTLFNGGRDHDCDGPLGKFLSGLCQSLPEFVLAGYVGSTKLMEVHIHGDLVRAADGVGFRAFAMGEKGISEHARLFEPTGLTNLLDVALGWRLASIVVGQKYLSDISATLTTLKGAVAAIAQFQTDEQASKIESAYAYLRDAERSLVNGARDLEVKQILVGIEYEMDTIQRVLSKQFHARLEARVPHGNLMGYADIEAGFPEKLESLRAHLSKHRLAGLTRAGAIQMLAAFPGGKAMWQARAGAVRESAAQHRSMCDELESMMSFEASQWRGKTEAALTTVVSAAKDAVTPSTMVSRPAMSVFGKLGMGDLVAPYFTRLQRPVSKTPALDRLKSESTDSVRAAANLERLEADKFAKTCSAVDQIIENSDAPTRCLVEWGPYGPVRITQMG